MRRADIALVGVATRNIIVGVGREELYPGMIRSMKSITDECGFGLICFSVLGCFLLAIIALQSVSFSCSSAFHLNSGLNFDSFQAGRGMDPRIPLFLGLCTINDIIFHDVLLFRNTREFVILSIASRMKKCSAYSSCIRLTSTSQTQTSS